MNHDHFAVTEREMKRWELLEKVIDGRLTLAGLCYTANMPRVARILVPGVPHHITQRGNNRQDVFYADVAGTSISTCWSATRNAMDWACSATA